MDWRSVLNLAPRQKPVESTAGSMPADKKKALKEALGDTVISMDELRQLGGYGNERFFDLYLALRDMCEGDMPNLRDTQNSFMRVGGHNRSKAMEHAQHALPGKLEALRLANSIAGDCYREMSWRMTGSARGSEAMLQKSVRVLQNIQKAQPLIAELITLAQSQQAGQGPGTKPV